MPLQAGRNKVAIVGFCDTSRMLTPWHDPSFEVWGLNRGHIFHQPSAARIVPGTQADRWFDMHGKHIWQSQDRRPGKHQDFLANFPGPVYLHQKFEELPNALVFPLQELADYFGESLFRLSVKTPGKIVDTKNQPYLSSSIAYEVALAIYEGFEEIWLTGVDLSTESEYAWQKPGVEYLLGIAVGKGIRVVLPDNCPLLRGTLYGRGFMREEAGPLMSYDQLVTRRRSIETEMQGLNQQLQQAQGAKTELEFLMQQMTPGLDHEMCDQRRQKMEAHIMQIANKLLQVQGSLKETVYWIHQTEAGQEPTEAIEQLTKVDVADLNQDEGPLTDLEEMQTYSDEPVHIESLNGHKPPLLVPLGV